MSSDGGGGERAAPPDVHVAYRTKDSSDVAFYDNLRLRSFEVRTARAPPAKPPPTNSQTAHRSASRFLSCVHSFRQSLFVCLFIYFIWLDYLFTMFLPENVATKDREEELRKAGFKNIETWSLEIIPEAIRKDASVSVQEVQCGDPDCAPIDTAVTIVFTRYVERSTNPTVWVTTEWIDERDRSPSLARPVMHRPFLSFLSFLSFFSGCNGIFGIPMEAREVTKEELEASFPTTDVLEKWRQGEDADWPPIEEPSEMPNLRFTIGMRVQCRIGPDVTKDWASGEVCLLWYREPSWPAGSFAPYKIKLDDGREIFAPGDMDQIIRKHEWMNEQTNERNTQDYQGIDGSFSTWWWWRRRRWDRLFVRTRDGKLEFVLLCLEIARKQGWTNYRFHHIWQ
jgi:hypothetical protein